MPTRFRSPILPYPPSNSTSSTNPSHLSSTPSTVTTPVSSDPPSSSSASASANAQPPSTPTAQNGDTPRLFNPADIVHTTQLALDADGDLVYIFETSSHSFGLIVQLRNIADLGWKECQAIVDGMRVAGLGSPRTPRGFAQTLRSLEHKYGSARGPIEQPDGRMCGSFYPVRGTVNGAPPNGLKSTALNLIHDRIHVTATTHAGDVSYSVRILMMQSAAAAAAARDDDRSDSHSNSASSQIVSPRAIECRAFIDVMTVLEPGDIVDVNTFHKLAHLLRKRYGNAEENDVVQGSTHVYNIDVRLASAETPTIVNTPSSSPTTDGPPSSHSASSNSPSPRKAYPHYKGFTITHQLADSGQATVYAGRRDNDDIPIAIKVFRGSPRDENGDRIDSSFEQRGSMSSATADAHEAYKTELRHLLKMSGHPNVVHVVDFFEFPKPALVMRFIDGQELGKWIQSHNGNPPPWEEALRLAIGIASGIMHLHHHGVVHRDLKSSNVLRARDDGTPVLIDLGLSSFMPNYNNSVVRSNNNINNNNPGSSNDDSTFKTKEVKGTCLWMAPEMIRSCEWSDRTDVYAFGLVLWELCTGRLPFLDDLERGDGRMQLMFRIADGQRPKWPIPDSVPQPIKDLIFKCWAHNPADRPSINRVLETLQGADDPLVVFNQHDLNKDGALGFAEFALFLEDYKPGYVPDAKVYSVFQLIDENGDGRISYEEFERFWRQIEIAGFDSVLDRGREPKLVNVEKDLGDEDGIDGA